MSWIAIVDDDAGQCRLVGRWLEREGYRVSSYGSGAELRAGMASIAPDAVLLDLDLGDCSGLDLLDEMRELWPHTVVLMMTASSEVQAVVSAMQKGAVNYLTKPITRTQLTEAVQQALVGTEAASEARAEQLMEGFGKMLGQAPAMRKLYARIERAAKTDVTVLVRGESGTGKELVAHALHSEGRRRAGPLVAVNCGAIAATLQESELFGHEKGAFTGASEQRKGRFEQASGGTLFLDEVAELSPSLQTALLRVLQERVLFRVGGSKEISVDVRIVAASHKDLQAAVEAGSFREDLFYRLAVFELDVPALRERGDDILALAKHFLAEATARHGRSPMRFDAEVEQAISSYRWPGNVRELRNAMESLAVAADEEVATLSDLPRRILARPKVVAKPAVGDEKAEIEQAIADAGGNMSEVIRQLGIPRTTLYRKLKKYGIS